MFLFVHGFCYSVTLVYNLKIRRAFDAHKILKNKNKKIYFLTTLLPIMFWRNIDDLLVVNDFISQESSIYGLLGNFRMNLGKNWWTEVSTGLEHQTNKLIKNKKYTKGSRTGFDDILCSIGYDDFINQNAQYSAYLVTGIPTTQKRSLLDTYDTLIGTRFYSVGGGAEYSYAFLKKEDFGLVGICQVRYLHFFPSDSDQKNIIPGDTYDLLLAVHRRKYNTVVEIGYEGTLFANQQIHRPDFIKSPPFTKNGGYINMVYLVPENTFLKNPLAIGCGASASFSSYLHSFWRGFWIHASTVF